MNYQNDQIRRLQTGDMTKQPEFTDSVPAMPVRSVTHPDHQTLIVPARHFEKGSDPNGTGLSPIPMAAGLQEKGFFGSTQKMGL